MSTPMTYRSLEHVANCNARVHAVLAQGGTHAEAIVVLANHNEELVHRIMQLEAIAPKKIKGPNGTCWIYHCPDHLIPVTES